MLKTCNADVLGVDILYLAPRLFHSMSKIKCLFAILFNIDLTYHDIKTYIWSYECMVKI